MTTVADMIRELRKQDPKAVLLWGGNGSCTVHAVTGAMKATQVAVINEHTFTTLGPEGERPVNAVLLDVFA